MKFSIAAVIAAAAAASAHANATVTTEIVDVYTTFCPNATQITHGSKTYTVTEPTTLTITDCPCTVTRPVKTVSSVSCQDCPSNPNTPVMPTTKPTVAPGNSVTVAPSGRPVPGGNNTATGSPSPSTMPPTAGAGKAVPALAGVVALVAALL